MYYDYRGRMIQSKSSSHLSGGIEKEYVGYDFTGHPLKRRYVHADSGQSPFTEEYSYTYDHMGRLNYMTHSLNGGQEMVLADNIYDGLGRLSSHLRGKSSRLESWYGYDVRSQLTSVNGFLFNQKLYYNEQRTLMVRTALATTAISPVWTGLWHRITLYEGMIILITAFHG